MLIFRCALRTPTICRTILQYKNASLIKNFGLHLNVLSRPLSTTPQNLRFGISIDDETREKKLKKINEEKAEPIPTTAAGKLKYYIKRYWYVAVPVYAFVYLSFLFCFYCLVKCGVDIGGLLEKLHAPAKIVDTIKNSSPETSAFVTAILLNKLCGPIRLVAVVGGTQGSIKLLKRFNLLKTAREQELNIRKVYSTKKNNYKLRYREVRKNINRRLKQNKK
uniref:Protein FAM210A (inferred by orthology to a human protein) n=1 Tax=Strongyloides venezuelensis TaxID=75913 RepID=A0A0K0F0J3_STRVS